MVLLLHGFPENHSCWRAQIGPLAARRRVIAPDWFGWGASERPPGSRCDYESEVALVAALLDSFGVDRVDLAGHDYGGYLAVGFAAAHPDRVRRLAILNSRAHRTFPLPYYLLFAMLGVQARQPILRRALLSAPLGTVHRHAMKRYVRQGAFDTARLEDYVGWLDTRSGRARYADYFAGYSVRPQRTELSAIRCPSAIIWGDRDTACPFTIAEDLAHQFPDATLTRIAGADHYVMEERPSEVTDALLAWLQHPAR
ncbi:alpha/beta fold hydrolase [Nocardia sp. BMG51109]|uniref:alpha/beta fold hydrolase n=1 Tax=Nocardia sp. BMG51109 TaxID=1056816 RepID=UPI001E621032|nr:alpha/beta hydrolase [Nocardia sp. BMG51109]